MSSKAHWEDVYTTKLADTVSWFQPHAVLSLEMIRDTGMPRSADIIDVGGGASTLVDDLAANGYMALTVLDLSEAALERSKARFGARGTHIRWLAGDITQVELPEHGYDVWHDRAAFHFLIEPDDRKAYVTQLQRAVKRGGHVVIATFAEDGPLRCSGLPVARYSPDALSAELGAPFEFVEYRRETHCTPSGTMQSFVYCRWRKRFP
jgi:ubiquinone/menaquinone biosynthesis C-methylase UbiE